VRSGIVLSWSSSGKKKTGPVGGGPVGALLRNVQSAQSFVRSTHPPARPPGLEGRLFTRLQLAIMRDILGRLSGCSAAQLASWVAILRSSFRWT
jgi:hypothetical protein